MEKLRVGIVGLGGIANGAHLKPLLANEKVEIVAICDILTNKIEQMAGRIPNKVSKYIDYKEMITKEKLDVVHICTPNYLHSTIAVFALDNGVNVLCEKPDAISVAEVQKMQAAERRSGKRLMAIRNNRHLSSSKELKQRILDGEFGELYTGRCGWIRRRGIPGKGGWFTTKALSGGGPLIDLGVHMIDLAIYLMGNPTPVSVVGSTYQKFADSGDASDSIHSKFGDAKKDGIIDVEDLATGFIKFDNGASLQIEFSWASNIEKEKNFVELRGTKSGFTWENDYFRVFDGKKRNKFSEKIDFIKQVKNHKNGHVGNINHFVDVLTKGTKPDYNIQQGVDMIKILEAIYQSASSGKEVIL